MLVSITDQNCNYAEADISGYITAEDLVYKLFNESQCTSDSVSILIESEGKMLEACEVCQQMVSAAGYFLLKVEKIEIIG